MYNNGPFCIIRITLTRIAMLSVIIALLSIVPIVRTDNYILAYRYQQLVLVYLRLRHVDYIPRLRNDIHIN